MLLTELSTKILLISRISSKQNLYGNLRNLSTTKASGYVRTKVTVTANSFLPTILLIKFLIFSLVSNKIYNKGLLKFILFILSFIQNVPLCLFIKRKKHTYIHQHTDGTLAYCTYIVKNIHTTKQLHKKKTLVHNPQNCTRIRTIYRLTSTCAFVFRLVQ